ncbi:hypothetical protein [Aureibaculum conchae]|uniref:hypothetical protein n=1 Tax=Aureibaculum sp. 2308TA14-22 TaxID=3108392 RepID=UPI0033985D7B
MSKVRNFLAKLDDYELAYFAKFKLNTYLEETQSEIQQYLTERNLHKSKIDRLISENPKSKLKDKKQRCSRCYSDKIRKDKVQWTETADGFSLKDEIAVADGFNGKATYKNEVICNVCGFWLEDPNHEKKKPFWHNIADFFVELFIRS